MKRYNGFTLMEVIISMALLSIITTTILPLFIKVYAERSTIIEQQQAQYYLSEVIQEWLYDGKVTLEDSFITIQDTNYFQKIDKISHVELKICLNWEGRNERNYTVCDFAKKFE